MLAHSQCYGADPKHTGEERRYALKGLALPRTSHSGEIALADSRRLHCLRAAAPVPFKHTIVTAAK